MKMKCYVENGVKMLDEKFPDWYKHINHKRLNLQFYNRCVVGQLESKYPNLGTLYMSSYYGFALESMEGCGTPRRKCQWGRLKQLWLAEIRKRNSAV